jgi:hypothetical protein
MLNELSNQIADLVTRSIPSVVQVEAKAARDGLVAEDIVITTARAVGRTNTHKPRHDVRS